MDTTPEPQHSTGTLDRTAYPLIHDDHYLLQALLDATPEYVYYKDHKSRYVKVTRAHARLMGFNDPNEVVGKTDLEIFPIEAAQRFYDEEQEILAGLEVVDREAHIPVSDGSTIWLLESKLPLKDTTGKIIGLVGISRNISRRVEAEQQLRQRESELQYVVEQQTQLIETIRALSTPIVPVAEHILVVPLVGAMSHDRSEQITERLLESVQQHRAEVVIIDMTGTSLVDTESANRLMNTMRAVSLLGARCVLVGIAPELAQTIVQLGIDLGAMITRSNLQEGVEYALAQQGRKIVKV